MLIDNMAKQATSPPPAGMGAELKHEKALSLDAQNLIVATEVNQYRARAVILATDSGMQKNNKMRRLHESTDLWERG